MTGPVILGYDYGLLLELVSWDMLKMHYKRPTPIKKTYKFETKKALLLLIPLHLPRSLYLVMKISTLN